MQAVHYTLYLRVFVLHTHQNEATPTEWAFVWLCVRAVAALQCEVCTQRTAACDCQSYDSCRISWSSSAVTLPSPSQFGFISPLRSCAAMLPSPPPPNRTSNFDHFWLQSILSSQRLLLRSTFCALCFARFSYWSKVGGTTKQKCIYLHIWQESWEERWNLKGEKGTDDKWEQKQSGGRWRQREWRRESDNSHVRTKECCFDATCQLILLLFEISAPEQTSQGQTTAHTTIIKVSRLCCSNTCATIMFSHRQMRLLAQTHTPSWMGNQNVNITILKLACRFGHLMFSDTNHRGFG